MISVPGIQLARITAAIGRGEPLVELSVRAARAAAVGGGFGGVIAATFSNPERFPSLAVRVAAALGLPAATPAFDVQMACSAYPYALYLAGHLAADTGKRILVIDGDVQSPLVDAADHATGSIFSDAATATVVSADAGRTSQFDFLSKANDALQCPAAGPIHMDGFAVFSFVAVEVSAFLKSFIAALPAGADFAAFVPHQANPYMIRQLARALKLEDKLLTLDESIRNPGSASVPLTLAREGKGGSSVLVAGFGAGYSAAVGTVRLAEDFTGAIV
jgi:3-oxoacyl-[acyl-carrier-protein] synthase-3